MHHFGLRGVLDEQRFKGAYIGDSGIKPNLFDAQPGGGHAVHHPAVKGVAGHDQAKFEFAHLGAVRGHQVRRRDNRPCVGIFSHSSSGGSSDATTDATTDAERNAEFKRIAAGASYAAGKGLKVNAGHGLHYHNVKAIAAIPELYELNIGHAIIGRAAFDGLAKAVSDMRLLMQEARQGI